MGFTKTSNAPSTHVLNDNESRKVSSGRSSGSPPSNPREGQRWNDMVWDGFGWVSEAAWRVAQGLG